MFFNTFFAVFNPFNTLLYKIASFRYLHMSKKSSTFASNLKKH